MESPFGAAILDHAREEREEPLIQRDGEETLDHPIEQFYFTDPDPTDVRFDWLADRVEGPLLDVGAGAGRLALPFQEHHETVAIEISTALVRAMAERGVADARHGDMFVLAEQFEADRFRSALVVGTQLGLARSMAGVREVLDDLATVTTADATAVVDSYDPADEGAPDLLGYRSDSTPGLAFRGFHFEYEGEVGETLLFRLLSPERLREAADPTPWRVADVLESEDWESGYFRAALTKV